MTDDDKVFSPHHVIPAKAGIQFAVHGEPVKPFHIFDVPFNKTSVNRFLLDSRFRGNDAVDILALLQLIISMPNRSTDRNQGNGTVE
jgi:hypothetical protein